MTGCGKEVDTITQSLRFSATVIFTGQAVMLVITTPALQSESILTGEHIGGCVLFEQKDKVEKIIERGKDSG